MTTPKLLVATRSHMRNRFKLVCNIYELNRFSFVVLRKGNKIALVLSLIAFAFGVISLFLSTLDTIWSLISALGGVIGLILTTRSALKTIFNTPKVRLVIDDGIHKIMLYVDLSPEYKYHGYEILKLPNPSTLRCHNGDLVLEFVVRSLKVDEFIRSNEIPLIYDGSKAPLIDEALRNHAATFELALRRKFCDCVNQYPREEFYNGIVTCLTNDLLPISNMQLRLFSNTFYHTFLTTDFVYRGVESVDAHPEIIYDGSAKFPAVPKDGRYILSNISDSILSNHVGVSTLVLTQDRKLILWVQTKAAGESQDRLAPTGSGSCDWADWLSLPPEKRTLTALITQAMEREFREESHPLRDGLRDAVIKTRIIGFFRWLRRGGKPEFVGVSLVDKMSYELQPNTSEVASPKRMQLMYPASSTPQLAGSVEVMLGEKLLSVPLWVLLKCLEGMVARDANFLENFVMEGDR